MPSKIANVQEKQTHRAALQAEALAFLDHALRQPEPLVHAAAAVFSLPADRQALVAAARHTKDPALFTLARQACVIDPSTPACGDLSLARQAELEPGNAAVWLALANEAVSIGDEAAALTAVARAARAPLMQQRMHLAAAALATVPWPADRMIGRILVVDAAARAGLSIGLPGHAALAQYCSDRAVADANRKIACGLIAEQLSRPGVSLMDATVGLAIARRSGWPSAKVDALQNRLQAAQNKAAAGHLSVDQRWSCRAGQAIVERVTATSLDGELAALEK